MDKYLKKAKAENELARARFEKQKEVLKEKSILKSEEIFKWYNEKLNLNVEYNLLEYNENKIVFTFPFFNYEDSYLGKKLDVEVYVKHYHTDSSEKQEEDCILKIKYEYDFEFMKGKALGEPEEYLYRGLYNNDNKEKIIEDLSNLISDENSNETIKKTSKIIIEDINIKIKRHVIQSFKNKDLYGIKYNINSFSQQKIYEGVINHIELGESNIKSALQKAIQKPLI